MAFEDFVGFIVLAAIAAAAIRYFSSRRLSSGGTVAAASAIWATGFLCALLAVADQDSAQRADALQEAEPLGGLRTSWSARGNGPGDADSVESWFRRVYESRPELTGSQAMSTDGGTLGPSDVGQGRAARSSGINRADCVALARTDTLAFLRLALENYEASVSDYTVTMTRQQRSDKGRLGRWETVLCKFRQRPLNVFLKWKKGAGRIDRALYAPALVGPQMRVHPTGLAGLFSPVVKVDLDGKHAKVAKRIQNFGFGKTLSRLVARGTGARAKGELSDRFLGQRDVAGRAALAVEWRFPHKAPYPYGRVVVQLCRETLLPVAISMWDARGELQGCYIYKDLRLNVGLTDEDFSPESCRLVD